MSVDAIASWKVAGAMRDDQSITPQWTSSSLRLIDGVAVRELANVPKLQGHLTEVFRVSWELDHRPVDHIFHVHFNRGALSAWHAHEATTDRLFVNLGMMRIVLFDARPDSPTHGRINEFRFGAVRPAVVCIPPQVWHGVQNIGDGPGAILNVADRAYDYERPDHWRIPHDSPAIPFSWST